MTLAELFEVLCRVVDIRDLWADDPEDPNIGTQLQSLRNWLLTEFGPF